MQPVFLFIGVLLVLVTCLIFLFLYASKRRKGIVFLQCAWFLILLYFVFIKCFVAEPPKKDGRILQTSRSAYIAETDELKEGYFITVIDSSTEGSCVLYIEVPKSVYQAQGNIATITYAKTGAQTGKFIYANYY